MIANIPEDQFNGVAHNLAWLNFVETPMHLRLSRNMPDNKGINSVASGYPKFDAYAAPVKKHYWKSNSPHIKRHYLGASLFRKYAVRHQFRNLLHLCTEAA